VTDARGLLDTSTLLLLPRITDPASLPAVPEISAITLAELSVGPLVTDEPAERARRLAQVQQAEADFDPIPFDADAARAFGQVAASLRRAGRKPAARALDALIASIAIANELPLYTCDPDDFAGIDGLQIRTIPHPDRATPDPPRRRRTERRR
jgi:predicted nucleic acid-binding protein